MTIETNGDAALEPARWDVVVVGAGPVGLTLTILLAQRGHRVLNVERWAQPYPLPRAVHFDDEVARVFQAAGIGDLLAGCTEPATSYELRNAKGETLAGFSREGVGASGWPAALAFHQPDLEALLAQRLASLPSAQQWREWEAADVTVADGSVALTGRTAAGPETVEARYVVGADGANSIVRAHLDTTITDLGFRSDFLVVDVVPNETRIWDPPAMQLCDPARPTTVVPGGPGRRRWEFMLLPGEVAEDMNRAEVAWHLLEPWGLDDSNARLDRHAVYAFEARWADTWRTGPLLLAGDAAHLMPPFFAQGMCAGVRDAAALAWRLDGILCGAWSDSCLDSYGPERLAHVRTFVERSVLIGSLVCITDPDEAAERDEFMAAGPPPDAPPLDEPPLLGPGLSLVGTPAAGTLLPQGRVARHGVQGLFDDVVGRGLLLIVADASLQPSPERVRRFSDIGGQVVLITGEASEHRDVVDLDGTYAAWFAGNGCRAALVRPDCYVIGGADDITGIDRLVDHFADLVGSTNSSSTEHGDTTCASAPSAIG